MTNNEIKEMMKDMCGDTYCYEGENNRNLKRYASNSINANYRKIPDGAVVLTKEEYEDLSNNYDKVYEQAKADILGNIANGGTSCHWCIEQNREQARKETAREIFNKLLNMCYDENHPRYSVAAGEIRYIAKMEYGIEVDE